MAGKSFTGQGIKILGFLTLLSIVSYVLIQVGIYFSNLIVVIGLAFTLAYLLIEPVNFVDRILDKIPALILWQPKTFTFKGKNFTLPQGILSFHNRFFAIVSVYLMSIILVIILSTQIIPPAIDQVTDFAKSLPEYAIELDTKFEEGIKYLENRFPRLDISSFIEQNKPEDIENTDLKKLSPTHISDVKTQIVAKAAKEILSLVQTHASFAVSNVLVFASGTLTGIGYVITLLVLSFYFLMDGKKLIAGINSLIPKGHIERVVTLQTQIHHSILGFLKGQVLLGILTGLFMFPVYNFFGVKFSVFLCLFLAMAEIIPVLGSSLGFIPAIIVMLFTDPVSILPVWFIFFMFQNVKDNIIAPKIVGDIIGLHPVTVILALWIGFKVGGIIGIIFAIPIASVINVIINFFVEPEASSEEHIPQT